MLGVSIKHIEQPNIVNSNNRLTSDSFARYLMDSLWGKASADT